MSIHCARYRCYQASYNPLREDDLLLLILTRQCDILSVHRDAASSALIEPTICLNLCAPARLSAATVAADNRSKANEISVREWICDVCVCWTFQVNLVVWHARLLATILRDGSIWLISGSCRCCCCCGSSSCLSVVRWEASSKVDHSRVQSSK